MWKLNVLYHRHILYVCVYTELQMEYKEHFGFGLIAWDTIYCTLPPFPTPSRYFTEQKNQLFKESSWFIWVVEHGGGWRWGHVCIVIAAHRLKRRYEERLAMEHDGWAGGPTNCSTGMRKRKLISKTAYYFIKPNINTMFVFAMWWLISYIYS